MTERLVILDRDGVINRESTAFVKNTDEWVPLDGSLEALGLLCRAGYKIAIATNQSGIGRGLFDRNALYAMHRKLRRLAAQHGASIDRIVYCPHRPDEGCDCRKPLPGLLLRLARHYRTALAGVPAVGDSLRDLDAAIAAGARPVLVLSGNGRKTAVELEKRGQPMETYENLLAFAQDIAGKQ